MFLVAIGCSETAAKPDSGAAGTTGAAGFSGGGSPLPSAQLQITPGDGTTAAGMNIELRVYDSLGFVDDAKLAEVSARAVLETWPEGTPVAFTTDTLAEAPPSYKVVRLVPTTTLADRWYLAGLSSLPAKIGYYAPAPLPDGKPAVRFRPGSQPRVNQIQFCLKEGAGMKLIVQLSEVVTLDQPTDQLVTLQVGGAASPCSWTGGTNVPLAFGTLSYACAALSETAAVVVTVAPGGTTAGGAALAGGSWSIDVSKLPAGSCRTFQTPI